jgi:hypothetical protein
MNILNRGIGVIIISLLLQSCGDLKSYYEFYRFGTGTCYINFKHKNRKMHLKLRPSIDQHFVIKDTEDMSVTNFENYGMGVSVGACLATRRDGFSRWNRDVNIDISPTIHFLEKETELLFSKKDDSFERTYRVAARILTLYEKGLKFCVDINNNLQIFEKGKLENYYFYLYDGMYYETDSDENMGGILKVYDFYKLATDLISKDKYYWWYDVVLFDNKRKYVDILVQKVQYFKPMENELWMISPYGNYILDYKTMNIRLVNDEIFKGHKFYFNIEKWDGLAGKLGYETIDIPVDWALTGYNQYNPKQ